MSLPKKRSTAPAVDLPLNLAQKTNLRSLLREIIAKESSGDRRISTTGTGALAEKLYNLHRSDFDSLFKSALSTTTLRITFIKRLIDRSVRSGGLIVHEGYVEIPDFFAEPAHA